MWWFCSVFLFLLVGFFFFSLFSEFFVVVIFGYSMKVAMDFCFLVLQVYTDCFDFPRSFQLKVVTW